MDDPRFIVLLLSVPLNKPVIKKGKKCKVLPDLDFNHLLCLLKTVSAWLVCVLSWWLCHFAVAGHTFSNPERVSEKFESGTWWVTFIKDTRYFCSPIIHCNNTCVCVCVCAAVKWRKCATTRWSEPEDCRGSLLTRISLDFSEASTSPSTLLTSLKAHIFTLFIIFF